MIVGSGYSVADAIRRYKETFGKERPAVDLSQKPVQVGETALNRTKALYSDGVTVSGADFERMMGSNDLLDLNYLLRGLLVSQSVARIMLLGNPSDIGDIRGVATGFMVSPQLLLTNYHVFPSMEDAASSVAEFGYKRDMAGVPCHGAVFRCRPDIYFFNSMQLDYSLVAMESVCIKGAAKIESNGWLRLNPIPGKVEVNEFVSIIQHPEGEPMQLSIRENQVKNIGDSNIWYMSDTARGSSGSPVFNDSWQVVALHHSSVPATNDSGQWLDVTGKPVTDSTPDNQIHWLANEGIRVSTILKNYRENAPAHRCKDELLACSVRDKPWDVSLLHTPPAQEEESLGMGQTDSPSSGPGVITDMVPGGMRLTVPVVMTLNVSLSPGQGVWAPPSQIPAHTGNTPDGAEELAFDGDYPMRKGYSTLFLPDMEVAMPALKEPIGLPGQKGVRHVRLDYHHFSVVFDTVRRLARFTAENADMSPEKHFGLSRKDFGNDAWRPDPRLKDSQQILDDELYSGTDFDLGHIVRRDDNAWGETRQQAIHANSDTFHYTNCSPQHASFNRSNLKGLWGELENRITNQHEAAGNRMVIYAGPVLADDDPVFNGRSSKVQIPVRFWKIIVCKGDDGKLATYGFILSQADLVEKVIKEERFEPGDKFKVYQYAVKDITEMTGIEFPDVVLDADVKKNIVGNPHELFSTGEMLLI
jgi:endonuclease G